MPDAGEEVTVDYRPIPMLGLSAGEPVPFPLYLRTGEERFVLYQPSGRGFDRSNEDRLLAEGVLCLNIRETDRPAYSRRIERSLDAILRERALPTGDLAQILQGVAIEVVADLFATIPKPEQVARARRVMGSTASLVNRDDEAFDAIRDLLDFEGGLAEHSLTVAMLSIGAARPVLGRDPDVLMTAGLAGLFHDVGRIGQDPSEPDPQHPMRGYHILRGLQMPKEVCEAALFHHERFDGSGFPDGLSGDKTPPTARIVAMMDTFHHLLSETAGGGVFDALKVQAQAYRGCFDPSVAGVLVHLFADARVIPHVF